MSKSVRIGRWIDRTSAEGPGLRFALWIQGCSIRCTGCFNPHLWSATAGSSISVQELVELVPEDVEGVTLLGGEPFEQAKAMADFAQAIRVREKSVMTFTGYTHSELISMDDPDVFALLNYTDLLVTGQFEKDNLDFDRPWVGSTNQEFHALTDVYQELVNSLNNLPDRLEVRISANGEVSLNGWADTPELEILLEDIGTRTYRKLT